MIDPVEAQFAVYRTAADQVRHVESRIETGRIAVDKLTADLATQKQSLVTTEATVAALAPRVNQNAVAATRFKALSGAGGPAAPYAGGRLLSPLPGQGQLSSRFGSRYDPYYHVWQLHAGIDLPAAAGTRGARHGQRASSARSLVRRLRVLHLHRARPVWPSSA